VKFSRAVSGIVSGHAPVLRDLGRGRRKQEPCHAPTARRSPNLPVKKVATPAPAVEARRRLTIFGSRELTEFDSRAAVEPRLLIFGSDSRRLPENGAALFQTQ
jgi:hypothetical protein